MYACYKIIMFKPIAHCNDVHASITGEHHMQTYTIQ